MFCVCIWITDAFQREKFTNKNNLKSFEYIDVILKKSDLASTRSFHTYLNTSKSYSRIYG